MIHYKCLKKNSGNEMYSFYLKVGAIKEDCGWRVRLYSLVLALWVFVPFLVFQTSYSQVIYNEEIQPIFNSHCTACHGGTSGVTLSSYEAVMNSVGAQYNKNIVIPGEPDESPLINKIEPNPDEGARMPQGGPYLSDEQITLIRQWIEEGARETPATPIAGSNNHPEEFRLLGNYPNPFNPKTQIRFNLPQEAGWSVSVYTSDGKFILEKSGFSSSGKVSVELNFDNLSSGLYIYVVEMRAGPLTYGRLSERMMLVK